ncbi:TadE/TadG family type IV pilus assembly protein [Bradyrhizobium sp. URHD0069]|uniref:TadE/TadG family type IV pilus assembly protein n=1 Tax=Bradyrhizobium sp. URHD0069 TaxID=1380355 RepID=UPI000AC3E5AA|nr:TadE/TadG family type IV pilus assembly protein [Bradyrhizobium sp. URHD0069]
MLKRSIESLWHDNEGSVLIEATILMPFLVTLMFGLFEFSWYFHKQQLVESGVRDAARYLARTALDTTPPTNPCDNATFVANAKNIATKGAISGGTARVSGWGVGLVKIECLPSIDNSAGAYSGATTIYPVIVSTTFADPDLGYFGMLGLTVPYLSASHTERSIGPG